FFVLRLRPPPSSPLFPYTTLFRSGGTGEFFSLSPAEVENVVRVATDEVRGRLPVLAGAGYGTAIAVEMAQAAERAGADGILLLRSEEHTSELQSLAYLVCRLLLEK